jgi:hypothetical protein
VQELSTSGESPIPAGFVTGHDFSRAARAPKSTWALQAAEKLVALKGHGFSRAVNAAKSTGASAPEGCFHCFYLKTDLFPQPVQPLRERRTITTTCSEFS